MDFTRRQWLAATGSAAVLGTAGAASARAIQTKKVLFFTKSSGFQHSVIARQGEKLGHAERILTEIGKPAGFDVVCSKDGGMLNPDKIGQFDVIVFYTTGDLTKPGTDKQPPITTEGEAALYEAIKGGKGFMGMHCATDTFGSHRGKGGDDPYIEMIGGHFAGHDAQQQAKLMVNDAKFPGADAFAGGNDSFTLLDEWYGLKFLNKDMHPVFTQVTEGMKGPSYEGKPNYPSTWARRHGKGKVFYTSMGHREDVWENPKYQSLLVGALKWLTNQAEASV